MNYEPNVTDDDSLAMLAPLRLSFLAAVKRIDRLRQEVFSCDGQQLIANADSRIDELVESFKNTGSASVSDVMGLVKFAGHMNDYIYDPENGHLELASRELRPTLMTAA